MATADPPLPAQVLAELERGHTIEAIKLLRESTGLGLKEAKDVIDRHRRPVSMPSSAPATLPGALPAAVVDALQRGEKIEAIRLLREQSGLELMDSKRAVEAYLLERGPMATGHSSGEVRNSKPGVWLVLGLALVAVLLYRLLRGGA